jgi:hypothetical protein
MPNENISEKIRQNNIIAFVKAILINLIGRTLKNTYKVAINISELSKAEINITGFLTSQRNGLYKVVTIAIGLAFIIDPMEPVETPRL